MDYMEYIISSIGKVFSISEDNISSLKATLADIDEKHLNERFSHNIESTKLPNDSIISKANLLNSLLEIVLENPNMEVIDSSKRKDVLREICESTAVLYEQIIDSTNMNAFFGNMKYLAMYSILSYMADRQTVSDLVIKDYIIDIKNIGEYFNNMPLINQLEFYTLYLIVMVLSNVKNAEGLSYLNLYIEKANSILEEIQQEELKKEEIDIPAGLKIAAYGNVIYLVAVIKDYLFTGKINDQENQDILSVIDVYSYNAFHLVENESIDIKILVHLLRYAFQKVAENSIWNIADKSPLIRKFIENNLSNGERYIYTLLPAQRDVISDVLTPKKSIVIGMPTSSGKSLLAEMHILFSIHNFRTDDFKPTVCYIVPTNALVSQVKRDLQCDFDAFDFNIETALPYYDVDEIENEFLMRKHIDILICTPEKLEALVRQEHPSIKDTRLVIMDEAHNLGDESRGSKFELALAAIKHYMKDVNFLLLSPFICNAQEISEWLADSSRNAYCKSLEWAPTKQYIGCNMLNSKKTESYLDFYKSARNHLVKENIEIKLRLKPEEVKEEMHRDRIDNAVRLCVVLNDMIETDGCILVLCGGRPTTVKLACAVKEYFEPKSMLPDMSEDPDVRRCIELVRLENGENDPLIECLKQGICYHNAGLSTLVKEAIEDLIRNNKTRVVFATTTLAQGMNFPIHTVIFDTVSIRNKGYLTSAEFWNIAGRAGRAYKDKEGYIILSYCSTRKATDELVKRYIKSDLENVISSLSSFFSTDDMISLDYDVLKEPQNAPVLNLLQYINHILKISYDYNIGASDIAKIRGILTDSYLYHSLDKQEGYLKAQIRLGNFVTHYINHVNEGKKQDMKKADDLGISDISYTKVKSMVGAFISELKVQGDQEYKASEIILQTLNIERLTRIIDIINKIPEIKIVIKGQGSFDAESIAKLLVAWVNGESVMKIARYIKRQGQSDADVISMCNSYLNSNMKSYMPWGINIYQNMCYDMQTDDAKMLPSYIYYGVSSKEEVVVSKLGVPRFAVRNVVRALRDKRIPIDIEHLEQLRSEIRQLSSDEYFTENTSGRVIKELVDGFLT